MQKPKLGCLDPKSWLRCGHQSRREYKRGSNTVEFVVCARTLVEYIELEGTVKRFLDCEEVASGLNGIRDL